MRADGFQMSLNQIIYKNNINNSFNQVESYLMKPEHFTVGYQGEDLERTIIVKRMDLLFNDKECQVLTFTDITMYYQLKKEEERNKLLTTLNTSVHHEMLGPLMANVEFAERLIKNL